MPDKTSRSRWQIILFGGGACIVLSIICFRISQPPEKPVSNVPTVVPAVVKSMPEVSGDYRQLETRLKKVQAEIGVAVISLRDETLRGMSDTNSPLYREYESAVKALADAVENHPVIVARKNEVEKLCRERVAVSQKGGNTCDLMWEARRSWVKRNLADKDVAEAKKKEAELVKQMKSYAAQEKELYDNEVKIGSEIEAERARLKAEDPELLRLNEVVVAKYEKMRSAISERTGVQVAASRLGALHKEKTAILQRLPSLRAQTKSSDQRNRPEDGPSSKNG